MNCICCNEKIERFLFEGEINDEIKEEVPEQCMWNDGVVGKLEAGFGSRYDTDSFYVAICDDCITIKLENKTIQLI